ncbi:MAG: CehA/McbA family metallohydrolase [Candidatus Omnitrophica bacterium]|nr:CehA/McbA family metallohydrolase [Candidatus Omnitrophota bacterium]MCM8768763.1 CehA/McbA family metallohydrolase [Candidatus Omnitrophota bacterium]
MNISVFGKKGNWYRGNLHLHTNFSDGTLAPEEICSFYYQAGYQFVALTDHWNFTQVNLSYDNFITIPAVEYHSGVYHIVALGVNRLLPQSIKSPQEIIDAINQEGGIPIMAHPYWSGITSGDLMALQGFSHLEIYNNVCQITKGKGFSSVHWDELLQSGRQLFGVAVDDAHHRPRQTMEDDLIGSWVMAKAESLDVGSLLQAIRRGDFYSSTGVTIHEVSFLGDRLTVHTSPVQEIRFISQNAQGERVSGCGQEIDKAEYELTGTERYLRIEAVDHHHRFAWTNPFYFNQV